MIVECQYEFISPEGGASILVSGVQGYSPGQPRKATEWRLTVPDEYAAQFGGRIEFASLDLALAALARHFCDKDTAAVEKRLVLNFDDRPSLA